MSSGSHSTIEIGTIGPHSSGGHTPIGGAQITSNPELSAYLVILEGAELGRQIELGEFTRIGRSAEAEVILDDSATSRFHAEVQRAGDEYQLMDSGSTNGTWLNDVQVASPTQLSNGDILHIGLTSFKFLLGDSVERAYHAELYKLSTTDPLTGIRNRRFALEELNREAARAQRHQRPLALLLMDIDHFKQLNDTYGHSVGDAVLKGLAHRLQSKLRRTDVFARFGGEEFFLLAIESDKHGAAALAGLLLERVSSQPFEVDGDSIKVTLSMGIADSLEVNAAHLNGAGPLSPEDLGDKLIELADERLYQAKRDGRDRYSIG